MSGSKHHDWDPGTYSRFRDLRLRPALDLLSRVGDLPDGDVVDLGCGSGAAAEALRAGAARDRRLIGVDLSPAMMREAEALGLYDQLQGCDIADWRPDAAPALIFSNAALHWVADHEGLLTRLAQALVPGGMLAVQVPHQNNAPSHRLWRTLADELCGGCLKDLHLPEVLLPAQYFHLLEPLGEVSLWETEYFQMLPPSDQGHPVRRYTEATYARPILDALPQMERDRLIRAYDDLIDRAYPLSGNGGALFPIRRLFFTLRRGGQ